MKRNILHLFHFPWTTWVTFKHLTSNVGSSILVRKCKRILLLNFIMCCKSKKKHFLYLYLVNMLRCLSRIHNLNIILSLCIARIHELDIRIKDYMIFIAVMRWKPDFTPNNNDFVYLLMLPLSNKLVQLQLSNICSLDLIFNGKNGRSQLRKK